MEKLVAEVESRMSKVSEKYSIEKGDGKLVIRPRAGEFEEIRATLLYNNAKITNVVGAFHVSSFEKEETDMKDKYYATGCFDILDYGLVLELHKRGFQVFFDGAKFNLMIGKKDIVNSALAYNDALSDRERTISDHYKMAGDFKLVCGGLLAALEKRGFELSLNSLQFVISISMYF